MHKLQAYTSQQAKKNTDTMATPSRRLPAAPILEVSVIAVCHMMTHVHRNMVMQL